MTDDAPAADPHDAAAGLDLAAVTRPHRRLLTYWTLCALCTGPAAPIVWGLLYAKFRTLRYEFERADDGGVSARWGLLFRSEVHLAYRRIQDLHLTSNVVQRWLGLATIEVQTAGAGGDAELKIEGVLRPDRLRDSLYRRMRGARGDDAAPTETAADPGDEALVLLREIRDRLTVTP